MAHSVSLQVVGRPRLPSRANPHYSKKQSFLNSFKNKSIRPCTVLVARKYVKARPPGRRGEHLTELVEEEGEEEESKFTRPGTRCLGPSPFPCEKPVVGPSEYYLRLLNPLNCIINSRSKKKQPHQLPIKNIKNDENCGSDEDLNGVEEESPPPSRCGESDYAEDEDSEGSFVKKEFYKGGRGKFGQKSLSSDHAQDIYARLQRAKTRALGSSSFCKKVDEKTCGRSQRSNTLPNRGTQDGIPPSRLIRLSYASKIRQDNSSYLQRIRNARPSKQIAEAFQRKT